MNSPTCASQEMFNCKNVKVASDALTILAASRRLSGCYFTTPDEQLHRDERRQHFISRDRTMGRDGPSCDELLKVSKLDISW